MRKPIAILALALTLAFTVSGCAGDTKPITQAKLADQLESQGELKPKFAECVAKEIYPKLTKSEKEKLNAPTPAADDEKKLYAKAKTAGQACEDKGVTPDA